MTTQYVTEPEREPDHDANRLVASEWARSVIAGQSVVLAVATTSLWLTAEAVQLAVIDMSGSPLLDTFVRPIRPILAGASKVHGITNAMVVGAPGFVQVAPILADTVRGRNVVIYNVSYAKGVLYHCWDQHKHLGRPPAEILKADCAMEQYATYAGDWSDFHCSYTWQKLPGAVHNALGDCRAVLALLRRMAAGQ